MSNLYGIGEHAFCPGCLAKGFRYRRDDPNHFRLHVPRDRWPINMREAHKPRVVIDGLVYDADKVPTGAQVVGRLMADALERKDEVSSEFGGEQCPDCEFKAKSAFGLRAHARKHAVSV